MDSNNFPGLEPGANGGRRKQDELAHENSDYERLVAENDDLKKQLAQAVYEARHDALTRLPNLAMLKHLVCPARRKSDIISVLTGQAYIMFDIDFFKWVNTICGHPNTNELLKVFAKLLSNSLRDPLLRGDLSLLEEPSDEPAGRWGGEEFYAICWWTSLLEAIKIAERCRATIETTWLEIPINQEDKDLIEANLAEAKAKWDNTDWTNPDNGQRPNLELEIVSEDESFRLRVKITVSVGVSHSDKNLIGLPEGDELGIEHEQELKRAFVSLNHVKKTGRNRVCSTRDMKADHETKVREYIESTPPTLRVKPDEDSEEVA